MNAYEQWVLPYLIRAVMRHDALLPYRQRLTSAAEGRVLEIGSGSGLNLPLYTSATSIVTLDPSGPLLSMAREAAKQARCPVDLLEGSAERIPLDGHSVDTVVSTWTLCSIPDASRALREVRRVLRSSGRLLFVEHGLAPDANIHRWQDRLTPVWKHIAGGCHLNRPIDRLVEDAGFRIEQLHSGYMQGPRILTFMYEGCAHPT